MQSNDGNPASGHGGADIVNLLMPSAVPAGFEVAATGEDEVVAGRRCAVVEASPRPHQMHSFGRIPGSEAFQMIAGGADFRLSVDLDTGVLLRVVKLVDSEMTEVCASVLPERYPLDLLPRNWSCEAGPHGRRTVKLRHPRPAVVPDRRGVMDHPESGIPHRSPPLPGCDRRRSFRTGIRKFHCTGRHTWGDASVFRSQTHQHWPETFESVYRTFTHVPLGCAYL